MEYQFFNQSDEKLIETSELPLSNYIAVALRSTGYDAEEDEPLEVAIVDFEGKELFHKMVKPQNIEEWSNTEASGGITPEDVKDAPELFQFEEELSDLYEKASMVVTMHTTYTEEMVEAAWITLPEYKPFDLTEQFLASHSTTDYPNEPSAAASDESIAAYYGIERTSDSLVETARIVGACYKALVNEHASERKAKGDEYWEQYRQRKEEEARLLRENDASFQNREKFLNRMNGALWLAGCIIFTSLVIQNYQNGSDMGIVIVFGAAAAFCLIRSLINFRK